MANVLAIDFGTTNTSAAWLSADGVVHDVTIDFGATSTIPSVVWFGGGGKILVGAGARDRGLADPHNTIYGWKRFLGARFASDFVQRAIPRLPYRLIPIPGEAGCAIVAGGEPHRLEEVTFHVIARVVELAAACGASHIDECVLTVPAHAGYRQRRATRRAAEMAGLDVRAVINEPTAAAFAPLSKNTDGTFLIFDLGGGTFDATLLRVRRGICEVLGTSGDSLLGGNDFDDRLVDAILFGYQKKTGVDLRSLPGALPRLQRAAEQVKIDLSTREQAVLSVPAIGMDAATEQFLSLNEVVPRSVLEQATAPLIEKALGICEDLVGRARVGPEQVTSVLFVGGQTRMPALRSRIKERFAVNYAFQPSPELAVSRGAAQLGHAIHIVVDVMPMMIGAMLPGGATVELVQPSSPLPCMRRFDLQPIQAPLPIVFFEATSAQATEREIIGRTVLQPMPMATQLEVRVSRTSEIELQLFLPDGRRTALPFDAMGG